MTGIKARSVKSLLRWKILSLNHLLAALYIPSVFVAFTAMCLILFSPNATLQASLFSSTALLYNFHLIEGALIGLSIFTALIAYYKKNYFYLITSAWLLCNLRLGSQMLDGGTFWLEHQLPENIIPYVNQLVIGMYFVLSQQLLQKCLGLLTNNNKNFYLSVLALGVFIASLFPYELFFYKILIVSIPLALGLSIAASIEHLKPGRSSLQLWQVILLSVQVCGLIAYVLAFFIADLTLIYSFNAFVFLLLNSSMVVLGIAYRIKVLYLNHNELRAIYQNSPFSVLKIDTDNQIIHSNRSFRRLCAKQSLPLPTQWSDIFPPQNWKHIQQRTQAGKYTELQLHDNELLKTPKPLFALHASAIHEGYMLILQDITPYMNTLNRLKAMADNDPVTQALNQRGLEKALQYVIGNLNQHQPCFLAYLDINHVNQVNRTYGHAAGDALLQEVSHRINAVLQQRYSFGRIGSDDFIFLLDNTTPEKAKNIAAQITDNLNQTPLKTPFRDYNLNVHLGLIEIGQDMDVQVALRTAQSACMDARRRNQSLVIYEHNSKEMQDRSEELQLFEHLESGTTRSLFVEMQPLLNLKDPFASVNVEVLLRIRRANGELIPLHTFIPSAEENGTITIIDKWVFMVTLEWLNANQKQLHKTKQVNINLSGHSLNNDQFIKDLFVILDKYEHLLHKLCVEITEGVALQDLARTREFMSSLQSKGVLIALDDFGAGYTSFSYLRELPANSIKIDGALIKDMRSKESNIAIVRTIVELARNLDMICVAEWVEDVETLSILQHLGVDYAQGFVISKSCDPKKILQAHSILDVIDSPEVIQFIQDHQFVSH